MPETVELTINGKETEAQCGATVAVAILMSDPAMSRRSVSGELRTPLCGMGTCFECRATVNGVMHVKTCQILCADGMMVETDDR